MTKTDTDTIIEADEQVETDETTTEAVAAAVAAADVATGPFRPVQLQGSVLQFMSIPGDTGIAELPTPEAIKLMEGHMWLLPHAPDDSHAMTTEQFAVVVSYISQNFSPEDGIDYGGAAKAICEKFLVGRQKHWNLVQRISEESRQATAHLPITENQMRMVYDSIVQALNGNANHWDPDIQTKINGLQPSTKTLLINQALTVQTRGDVTVYMRKFESLCGRPKRVDREQTQAPVQDATGVITGGDEPY